MYQRNHEEESIGKQSHALTKPLKPAEDAFSNDTTE